MRSDLLNALKCQFKMELATALPCFKPYSVEERKDVIWSYEATPNIFFFIFLKVAEDRDSFTIEIALNDTAHYPFCKAPASTKALKGLESATKWRARISVLTGSAKEHWWTFGVSDNTARDPALPPPDLDLKVRSAVGAIREVGVPYLEEIADKRKIRLKIRSKRLQ